MIPKMILRTLVIFFVLCSTINCAIRKCPKACVCKYDEHKRPVVRCTNGGLRSIPIQMIENNVEEIFINGPDNQLTIGPIFLNFHKLEILKISNSNIPAIGSGSFNGMNYLKVLDLSHNNITTIADDNFRGLDELVYLSLADNNIDRTPSAAFRYLTQLKELDLSMNMIEELVPRIFLDLKKLKTLDLSDNPLEELPNDIFKDIRDLSALSCRNCQLRSVNAPVLSILPNLAFLDLGENKITYINRNDFNSLRNLKRLKLDGNKLNVVLQYVFEFQTSLISLDLSRNELNKITQDAFHNLHNLTKLNLGWNKFERLEELIFHPLNRLRSLTISGNTELSKDDLTTAFAILPDLTSFSIGDMPQIPDNFFEPLSRLQFLNISNCSLDNTMVQRLILPLKNLEALDISSNHVTGATENLAIKLTKIGNVITKDNPIMCDKCHMGPIIDRIKDLRWDVLPECLYPESVRGKHIQHLDIESLETCLEYKSDEGGVYVASSSSSSFMGGESIGAYVIGGLVTMAVVIILMLIIFSRHSARYYTREENNTEIEKQTAPITTNNEINFKFPLDDRVCTIDEICLPPPPPTPDKNIFKKQTNK